MPKITARLRPLLLGTPLLAVACLAACGPVVDDTAPTPTSSAVAESPPPPTPAPTPSASALPDVPVRGSSLEAATATPAPVPPAALSLPTLGVALPVDPVGVQADGQMEIPPLAERAGWYRFGVAPGAASGTAVIAAHVDSVESAGLGPFARLQDLAPGDAVEVTLADGSLRSYAVTTVERQAKPVISWPDVFTRDGTHRLVLITCGGTFRPEVRSYSDNVLVTAEPVGGS